MAETEALEQRALDAERRLDALELALPSATHSHALDPVELHDALLALRRTIGKERAHKHRAERERDDLERENARLLSSNAKLQYRVEHLASAVRKADAHCEPPIPPNDPPASSITPFD
jgi:chromosome segregation ATPase